MSLSGEPVIPPLNGMVSGVCLREKTIEPLTAATVELDLEVVTVLGSVV